MATSVSIAIMAHRKRRGWAEQLREQLGHPPVVWDRRDDVWDTGSRAMLKFDGDASWHVVIQDDALPCEGFPERAAEALSYLPETLPASFCLVDHLAERFGIVGSEEPRWVRRQGPWGGVAIALPTAQIPEIVAFGNRKRPRKWNSYDKRIAAWSGEAWYSVPSLVDHRPAPTLLGKSRDERKRQMRYRIHRFGVPEGAWTVG